MADGLLDGWDYGGATNPVLYPQGGVMGEAGAPYAPPQTAGKIGDLLSFLARTYAIDPAVAAYHTMDRVLNAPDYVATPRDALTVTPLMAGGSFGRGGLGAGPRMRGPAALPEEPPVPPVAREMPSMPVELPPSGPSMPVPPETRYAIGGRPFNIGLGSDAPLFDLSRLHELPDVPQLNLTRLPQPPKGIPQRVLDLGDPANMARIRSAVEQGIPLGGVEWFNTTPLLQGWQERLGTDAGQQAYERYLNLMGPTSQQTRVPENIRNASYLNYLVQSGQGLPPPGSKLPYPYGMMGQTLENARTVLESGFPLTQPKTASFTQNLLGNYQPYTFDTHMARLYGLRDSAGKIIDRPDPKWYGYLEGLGQNQAAEMGLFPAAHQAAGWLTMEGLRSPREPFMNTFESRVRRTAAQRDETPMETLDAFYRGERPLLETGLPLFGAIPSTSSSAAAQ